MPVKHEAAIAEDNAVKQEAATAEINAKLEQVKSEDNPILHQLLKTCSTFPKIRRTLAYVRRFVQNARKRMRRQAPSPYKN